MINKSALNHSINKLYLNEKLHVKSWFNLLDSFISEYLFFAFKLSNNLASNYLP